MDELFSKFREPLVPVVRAVTPSKPEMERRGAQEHSPTDEDKSIHAAQSQAILTMLQRSELWIPSSQLVPITHRFSANILTLRRAGHVIINRRVSGKEFEWRYVEQIESLRVEKGWKEKYYQTSHWKHRRKVRLGHDGWKCCNCKTTTELQVHHWRYDLFEELIGDLMTLCGDCHMRIHSNVRIKFPAVLPKSIHERIEI